MKVINFIRHKWIVCNELSIMYSNFVLRNVIIRNEWNKNTDGIEISHSKLMAMIVRETTESLEATKGQFTNKDAGQNNEKETAIACHDNHHKQIANKGGESGYKASDRIGCP